MDTLFTIILSLITFVVMVLLALWAFNDARDRQRNPLIVIIAVTLFFPWGWIAWLLFRPNKK